MLRFSVKQLQMQDALEYCSDADTFEIEHFITINIQ